jgi:hypothetical protein
MPAMTAPIPVAINGIPVIQSSDHGWLTYLLVVFFFTYGALHVLSLFDILVMAYRFDNPRSKDWRQVTGVVSITLSSYVFIAT